MSFQYILEKIKNAEKLSEPFDHYYVENFFNEKHFEELTSANEIFVNNAKNDKELFEKLYEQSYKMIEFPGCVTDEAQYLEWHKDKTKTDIINSACEGFGVVLRLMKAESPLVLEFKDFMNSKEFQVALAEKYGISIDDCNYDAGIQKYLDGYEISPHPDIRRKALTYMVNVNPSPNSEGTKIHTHYLKFKKQFNYIYSFWDGNGDYERCWVPWDWCETQKLQTKNNTMVLFSPSNDTMHAVKAEYDHLEFQRTQLYGNFWYKEMPPLKACDWENLVIKPNAKTERSDSLGFVKALLPNPVLNKIRGLKNKKKVEEKEKKVGKRSY